ncbi:MAG: type II secretion system protein [Patescibacteria group bacterium]|nr:type II secretion system protein [Patescibacteria group bacterium]
MKKAFTLIELLVVITCIGLIASLVMVGIVRPARQKSRDIKRITEIHQIQKALYLYYHQFGHYPNPISYNEDDDGGGWDFGNVHMSSNSPSEKDNFITPLEEAGFFAETPRETYFPTEEQTYRYAFYSSGSENCGPTPFYLLMAKLERPQSKYNLKDQVDLCISKDFLDVWEVIESEDWYAIMGKEEL